jgi:hypothetical protein
MISGMIAGRWVCDLRIGKAKTFMRALPLFLRFQSLSTFPPLYLSLRNDTANARPGVIAHMKCVRSHNIRALRRMRHVEMGLRHLLSRERRGACGCV